MYTPDGDYSTSITNYTKRVFRVVVFLKSDRTVATSKIQNEKIRRGKLAYLLG